MIERFVTLAQKHAPELEAVIIDGMLRVADPYTLSYVYVPGEPTLHGGFTITLLEYLKGLAKVYRKWPKDNPSETYFPKELSGHAKAKMALEWHSWDILTPEAVIRACIEVWEAME